MGLQGETTLSGMVGRKRKRCGTCSGCVNVDCGKCIFCLDKPKFGGAGKKKHQSSFMKKGNVSTLLVAIDQRYGNIHYYNCMSPIN